MKTNNVGELVAWLHSFCEVKAVHMHNYPERDEVHIAAHLCYKGPISGTELESTVRMVVFPNTEINPYQSWLLSTFSLTKNDIHAKFMLDLAANELSSYLAAYKSASSVEERQAVARALRGELGLSRGTHKLIDQILDQN